MPNLIDTDKYKIKRKKRSNTLNLMTLCALRKGKGIERIIKALDILVNEKNVRNIHLNVVGDGYLMDFYRNSKRIKHW